MSFFFDYSWAIKADGFSGDGCNSAIFLWRVGDNRIPFVSVTAMESFFFLGALTRYESDCSVLEAATSFLIGFFCRVEFTADLDLPTGIVFYYDSLPDSWANCRGCFILRRKFSVVLFMI